MYHYNQDKNENALKDMLYLGRDLLEVVKEIYKETSTNHTNNRGPNAMKLQLLNVTICFACCRLYSLNGKLYMHVVVQHYNVEQQHACTITVKTFR